MSPRPTRIAIIDLSAGAWTAGGTYTEMLARSLTRAASGKPVELVLLRRSPSPSPSLSDLPLEQRCFDGSPAYFVPEALSSAAPPWLSRGLHRGAALFSRGASRLGVDPLFIEARRARADVVLPLTAQPHDLPFATIGWIPDFQHLHLPDLFSAEERAARDATFEALCRRSSRVIVSSAWARSHLEAALPAHAHKALLAPFPSLFALRPLPTCPGPAPSRYHLPERFALVVNQVWAHKNHAVVVDAVAEARGRGVDVPLVIVGAPVDYRDPSNKHLSTLLQQIASRGVHDLVRVLGSVPFGDLVDLMRRAVVGVQPSRFEGWSTSVEDMVCLGRPLLCSDLPVHREQAPDAGFFGCDDPSTLATLLIEAFERRPAGPDADAERAGIEREQALSRRYGEALLDAAVAASGRSGW